MAHFAAADLLAQVIGEAAGELEDGFGRRVVRDQRGIAFPADLDAGEQIGLGPRQLVEPRGLELHLAEDLGIGGEGDRGAAPVGRAAEMLEGAERLPPAEALAVELPLARDLDDGVGRQRVDHAHADAVQAPARRIGLAVELAARMERREDHLERRLVGEFGMRIDGDAAAIVDDREAVARIERDFDPAGMPRDGLVHRIVEHFGGEMVERALVGAADIHARAAADGLEPLEHFDRRGVIGAGHRIGGSEQVFVGHGPV